MLLSVENQSKGLVEDRSFAAVKNRIFNLDFIS
jgi:hypothetical protein